MSKRSDWLKNSGKFAVGSGELLFLPDLSTYLLTILLTQNVFREKIEVILQETLFEPSTLLETTVSDAMTQVLEIRDSILERTKKIRQKDESITICPDQDVNQDQFLTTARMEVMTVLLSLIEQEAATPEKLQVSKQYSVDSIKRTVHLTFHGLFFY